MEDLNKFFEKYIGKHIPHWESPRNWFTPAPEGSYNTIWSTADKKECFFMSLVACMCLLLLYTGAEAGELPFVFKKIAIVYIIVFMIYGMTALTATFERLLGFSLPAEYLGLGDIHENPEKLEKTTYLAILSAIIYIILNYLLGTETTPISVAYPYNLLLFLSLAAVIPYMEECLFSAAILATLAQRLGVIPSILLTSILRVLFHIFIVGSKLAAIPIFLWGILISYIVLAYRTKYPAILSHAIINAIAYLYLIL